MTALRNQRSTGVMPPDWYQMRIAASSQNDKIVIFPPPFRQGRYGKISCKHHSDDRHCLPKTSIGASLSMIVAARITKRRWAIVAADDKITNPDFERSQLKEHIYVTFQSTHEPRYVVLRSSRRIDCRRNSYGLSCNADRADARRMVRRRGRLSQRNANDPSYPHGHAWATARLSVTKKTMPANAAVERGHHSIDVLHP
ncbi:hypothetical protein LMG28727_06323 [Paraburkholderia kirstenboschensis]|nr:hypothetical protein LMG28727_06323 [Paraburkholderia kirstenboschensis]